MAKKSAAEWKKEGDELKALLNKCKKKEYNFGLVFCKEGMNLVAHPMRGHNVLFKEAKGADGATAKGVKGILNVQGTEIFFECMDDELPGGIENRFKQYLALAKIKGLKARFNLKNGEDAPKGDAPAPGEEELKEPKAPGEEDGDAALKKKLTADLKVMSEVFKLSFPNMSKEDAKQIKTALKAIAGAIGGGDLNGAQNMMNKLTLLTGVNGESPKKPITYSSAPAKKEGKGGSGKGGDVERKKKLAADYGNLKSDIAKASSSAEGKTKSNLQKLVKGFGQSLKKDELDLAEKALEKLGSMVSGVLGDGKKPSDLLDDLAESVSEAVESASDTLSEVVGEVTDFITGERPLTEKEQKEFPQKLSNLKIPAARQESLMKLAVTNRTAFEKTLQALEKMNEAGAVDISPDAIAASQTALANAKEALDKAEDALETQQGKLEKAEEAQEAAKKAEADAIKAQEAEQKALDDFQNALPDLASMSDADRNKAVAQSNKLINALEDAKALVGKTKTALEAANKNVETEKTAVTAAETKVTEASDAKDKAEGTRDALDRKKGLIDALAFGPLSPNAKTPLDEQSVAKFVDAFNKDPQTASAALELAGQVDDPKALAENVGMVCDKVADGFADKNGKKLDATPEQLREMAANALKMGARQGDDYFKGFEKYLETGKQHEPDPCGGMDPDQELGDVAVKRSTMMANAMLDENGKVDVNSEKAKGAMEHMQFHPGSLSKPSPAVNEEMQRVTKMFKDPTTGPQAQTVIDGVKKPTNVAAQKVVAQTTGKKSGELTDADSKAAVLSAMMSPMAQGPVGSCFTTAPARRLKQSNPLEAMKGMAEVATTGMFTPKSGSAVPILSNVPEGENPLMRAWEYAGATAAARVANSAEGQRLRGALFGGGSGADNLNAIKGVVGADAWGDKLDATQTPPKLEPGIRSKLRSAMNSELKFIYDAAPKPETGPGGGGGDGRSTDGGYAIFYKNKPIRSEEAFEKAIKEIALNAAGETEDTEKGKAIIAIVDDPKFKAAIMGGNNYEPWALEDGGMEDQATQALMGGNPSRVDTLTGRQNTDTDTQSERTRKILDSLLTNIGGKPDDLYPIGTSGTNANHAFNGLPNHPSFDKLKDPNSGDKIKAELLDPGKKIATDKMPVAQAAALFDKQVEALVSEWGNPNDNALKDALKKRPDKEMTPKELSDHVKNATDKLRKAEAKKRAEAFIKDAIAKGKTQSDGTPFGNGDLGWVTGWFESNLSENAEKKMDKMLLKEFKPPEVVIADSNWGGPDSQIYFVVAPDPKTGELRMYEKDGFSGEMTPIGDNWVDATWDRLEG